MRQKMAQVLGPCHSGGGTCGAPCSWLHLGPVLAIATIWRNEPEDGDSMSPSLSLQFFQNKLISLNDFTSKIICSYKSCNVQGYSRRTPRPTTACAFDSDTAFLNGSLVLDTVLALLKRIYIYLKGRVDSKRRRRHRDPSICWFTS